jgi:hypothetical protein
VEGSARIELTLRLWSAGSQELFDRYVEQLMELLPRNHGALERRAAEVATGPGHPDALVVLSFPDSTSVDGFLRDPLRTDLDDLAAAAVSRSLITDSRHRHGPAADQVADVVPLRTDDTV